MRKVFAPVGLLLLLSSCITFVNGGNYPVGIAPYDVAVGDFDRDGRRDIVVTNVDSSSVSVLLANVINGTFRPAVNYGVGQDPQAVAVGDFNRDDKLDLAVANAGSSTVSVLLGNGDGTFQPADYHSVGQDPRDIVADDLNGDGRIDIATANHGDPSVCSPGTISVLLGNGNGTFSLENYDAGLCPGSLATGDLNADGHRDLVTQLNVLLGNGDGTFQGPLGLNYGSGQDPGPVVLGDFNRDGKPDLAGSLTIDSVRKVVILLGSGDGTFQPAGSYSAGSWPVALAVADGDRSGTLDLAAASVSSGVSVLLGNGNGTFRSPSTSTFGAGPKPTAIAVGEFNRDGYLDLVVPSNSGNYVTVLLTKDIFKRPTPTPVAKPDFNGDGQPDLLWRRNDGVVGLWEMNGVTSPRQVWLTPTIDPSWNLVGAGDLNRDGKPEIVWQNIDGRLEAWFMSGETMRQSMDLTPISPGSTAWKVVAIADMNGDHIADLIWQHDDGSLAVWYMFGITMTSWAYLTPRNVGDTQWRIVGAGDVNGDGQPDLIWRRSDGWLVAWIMSGAKMTTWLYLTPRQVDPAWRIGAVLDLDGDGQTDLVWQHRDGWVAAWLMAGTKAASMPSLRPHRVDSVWQLVGPR